MEIFEERLAAAPILIVDDNDANILLLENILRQFLVDEIVLGDQNSGRPLARKRRR